MSDYPMDLLNEALERAKRLVSELESQRAQVEASPPDLAPSQIEQGRHSMDNAIASARRMLVALEDAWEVAVKELVRSEDEDGSSNRSDPMDGQDGPL